MTNGSNGDLIAPKAGDPLQGAVSEKLKTAIEDLPLPEPQKQQLFARVGEFVAYVERGGAPRIDPAAAKIMAEAAAKDADNKFQYLSRQQANRAAADTRRHDLDVQCHRDAVRLMWPIIVAILVVLVGTFAAGLYLTLNGKEAVGGGMISAVLSLTAGYIAGFGTPRDLLSRQKSPN